MHAPLARVSRATYIKFQKLYYRYFLVLHSMLALCIHGQLHGGRTNTQLDGVRKATQKALIPNWCTCHILTMKATSLQMNLMKSVQHIKVQYFLTCGVFCVADVGLSFFSIFCWNLLPSVTAQLIGRRKRQLD